jgi:4-hydroxy-2-oxoglutarate aldolase
LSLCGVVPPLVTPFRSDGDVDLPGLERNLESLKAHDLSAFLVLGSSGEAGSLDEGEKLAVIETARRALAGRALLAGTGLEGTRATVALTRKAADLGVDGVLVLTPHYYRSRMSEEALRRHYEAVAAASPVPVYLYSVPAFTGLSWPAGLAGVLAAHPRIAGIKESSGDVALLARVVAEAPRTFEVACGNAPAFYPSLCVGAAGGVLGVANCVPDVAAALFRAFRAGDHERARHLQAALLPLAAALGPRFGVAGIKAAMDAAGFHGGHVRSPLLPVDGPARQEIAGLVARARSALG